MLERITFPGEIAGVKEVGQSSSVDSEFIPLQSFSNGERVIRGDSKVLFYSFYAHLYNYATTRKLSTFCGGLFAEEGDTMKIILKELISIGDQQETSIFRTYFARYGLLYEVLPHSSYVPEEHCRVLMCLAVRREEVFHVERVEFNFSKFCLVVSNELVNEHKKLWRNVKNIYLLDQIEGSGIDVLYTDSIMVKCYRNRGIEAPKFKTINEMRKYSSVLNTHVGEIIKRERAAR